jgi:ethanolamine permease
MGAEQRQGLVRYESVDGSYLEKRRLRRSAGWSLLWAMAVGAVISGFFTGWNTGLSRGGFGGLAIATVVVAILYLCLVYSIAELSAALPHAGGFFSFTRCAFGPLGGFLCGMSDTIEYVFCPAVVVVGIGGYLHQEFPGVPVYLWWLLAYGLFVGVNIHGVALSLRVGLVITLLAVLVLVIFFAGVLATNSFRSELLFNIPAHGDPLDFPWLPQGLFGILKALPFAIWFYLAIEQVPLAAEEAHDAANDVPRALTWGIVTVLVLSAFVLVLNPGVGGGANALATSDAPLADGFKAIFGDGGLTRILCLLALSGLIATFTSTIYAYGRVLFALSRAGYLPRWISVTGSRHTPYVSLLLGGAIGLVCAGLIELTGGGNGVLGSALLYMTVFGAVISYILVLLSFLKLRYTRPDLPRPYRSPLGVSGAVVGVVLALTALIACFAEAECRPAVYGLVLFLAVAVLYFLLYSRHRLVAQAPEEEMALLEEAKKELTPG